MRSRPTSVASATVARQATPLKPLLVVVVAGVVSGAGVGASVVATPSPVTSAGAAVVGGTAGSTVLAETYVAARVSTSKIRRIERIVADFTSFTCVL